MRSRAKSATRSAALGPAGSGRAGVGEGGGSASGAADIVAGDTVVSGLGTGSGTSVHVARRARAQPTAARAAAISSAC
jgi:hypothetical protein